jgi:hypothetical protein
MNVSKKAIAVQRLVVRSMFLKALAVTWDKIPVSLLPVRLDRTLVEAVLEPAIDPKQLLEAVAAMTVVVKIHGGRSPTIRVMDLPLVLAIRTWRLEGTVATAIPVAHALKETLSLLMFLQIAAIAWHQIQRLLIMISTTANLELFSTAVVQEIQQETMTTSRPLLKEMMLRHNSSLHAPK